MLARFDPVQFDPAVIDRVEKAASAQGLSHRRMPSGAGHDAQMLARMCPTGMIFVPSVKGLSHNVREHTEPADLVAGAHVLLQVLTELADRP
jgi:N-carbamoyl-L-amino-acid hydrolase